MEATEVKIGEKTFRLKFGLGVLKALGKKIGQPSFEGVVKSVLEACMMETVEFDKLDIMHLLIICAIEGDRENSETITIEELDDLFLSDMSNQLSVIQTVYKGFMESLPLKDLGKIQAQAMGQLEKMMSQAGTN